MPIEDNINHFLNNLPNSFYRINTSSNPDCFVVLNQNNQIVTLAGNKFFNSISEARTKLGTLILRNIKISIPNRYGPQNQSIHDLRIGNRSYTLEEIWALGINPVQTDYTFEVLTGNSQNPDYNTKFRNNYDQERKAKSAARKIKKQIRDIIVTRYRIISLQQYLGEINATHQ